MSLSRRARPPRYGKENEFYNRSYVARGGEFWEERTKETEFTLPILARHVRRSLLDRRCFRFEGGEGGRAF